MWHVSFARNMEQEHTYKRNTNMCQDRSHSDTHVPHQIEICIESAYSTQCNFGDVQVQIEHMPNKQQNSEIFNKIHFRKSVLATILQETWITLYHDRFRTSMSVFSQFIDDSAFPIRVSLKIYTTRTRYSNIKWSDFSAYYHNKR
jgi:hypothetical protein